MGGKRMSFLRQAGGLLRAYPSRELPWIAVHEGGGELLDFHVFTINSLQLYSELSII